MKSLHFDLSKRLEGAAGPLDLAVAGEVPAGSVLAVMGASGAGKTSLIRMLAGLMRPDQGCIKLGSTPWFDAKRALSVAPQDRKLGYVFQEYGLFPHWTVQQNLAFALPKGASPQEIETWLERIQLTDLADRKPQQLSGGQRQRVALVRAMIRQPEVLLLDEPLAAQDRTLRKQLQTDLKQLLAQQPTTTVLVSHDPAEVARLADQVMIIEAGKVQQVGSPAELFGLAESEVIRLEVIRCLPDGRVLVWIGERLVPISPPSPKQVGEWIEWLPDQLGT